MVSAGCWFSNTHDLRTPPAMKMPVCSRNSIYSVVKERTRISGASLGGIRGKEPTSKIPCWLKSDQLIIFCCSESIAKKDRVRACLSSVLKADVPGAMPIPVLAKC